MRYDDEAYSRETSPDLTSISQIDFGPMRPHIVPYNPNVKAAAFPSKSLTQPLQLPSRQHWSTLIKKEEEEDQQSIREHNNHSSRVNDDDDTADERHDDNSYIVEVTSEDNTPATWSALRPGIQIYIFDSLLLQARYPGIVAKILGLTTSELQATLKLRNDRLIQPESTQMIWDRCRMKSIDTGCALAGYDYIKPEILAKNMDKLIFAEQFKNTTEAQKRLAVRFLRSRGIQGRVVDALDDSAEDAVVQRPSEIQKPVQETAIEECSGNVKAKINLVVKQMIASRTNIDKDSRERLHTIAKDVAIAFQTENDMLDERLRKMPLSEKDKQLMLATAKKQIEEGLLRHAKSNIEQILQIGTKNPKNEATPQHMDGKIASVTQQDGATNTDSATAAHYDERPNQSSTPQKIAALLDNLAAAKQKEPALTDDITASTAIKSPPAATCSTPTTSATPQKPARISLRTTPERPSFSPLTDRSSPDHASPLPLPSPINVPMREPDPDRPLGGSTPWLSKLNKEAKKS